MDSFFLVAEDVGHDHRCIIVFVFGFVEHGGKGREGLFYQVELGGYVVKVTGGVGETEFGYRESDGAGELISACVIGSF